MFDKSDKEKRLIASLQAANLELQREIAERRRIENVLREMMETYQKTSLQLRCLINAMPDIVCFKEASGKWLEANEAMLELFDLQGVDYEGKTDAELGEINSFYRDAFSACLHSDLDAWEKGSLYRGEEAIAKPNGIVKIYDIIKVPLFYPDGSRNRLVVLGRDITERKQTEKTCFFLASIVESSDDAIIGHTLEGIIYSWNRGAEQVYGYTAEEVKGRSISLLTIPDRPNEMRQILENIAAGSSIERYETRHIRKDGKGIDVALTMSPIKDERGEAIAVSTIARDASDRKQIERYLEQLRYQNQLILEYAGEGICGLDLDAKITFANPAAAEMTRYSVRELVNSHWGLVSDLGIDKKGTIRERYNGEIAEIYRESSQLNCKISATLQKGVVCYIDSEVFWRKDGSSFPVEYVSTPIQKQGEIIGAVITFKDITERQAIERMKDEFISVVSHELRTPLASLHGALGLLASGLLDGEQERGERLLNIAVANANRLVHLISDILDLERLNSDLVTMAKQPCNVAELMVQAATEIQPIAEKAQVNLSVMPLEVQVWGCPDRLIQTLTNLIGNAIKFSPKGSKVWLSGDCHPSPKSQDNNTKEVLIVVKDQGRGIPADKLETIFGRFQQVDASDSREKGGTGLGLAICRRIVHQHDGRIWAESTSGEGSTFFIALPVFKGSPS